MKQPGEPAKLYYDAVGPVVEGDVIETSTGRRYLVTAARQSWGPIHPGRWHLETVVLHPTEPMPADAVVHPLHWYRR